MSQTRRLAVGSVFDQGVEHDLIGWAATALEMPCVNRLALAG
jgi:hypothetical protein